MRHATKSWPFWSNSHRLPVKLTKEKMLGLRVACRKVPAVSSKVFKNVSRAHGNMKKHIRVEENAGLRELSYFTWEFNSTSLARLIGYMILPSFLFYTLVIDEFVSYCSILFLLFIRILLLIADVILYHNDESYVR